VYGKGGHVKTRPNWGGGPRDKGKKKKKKKTGRQKGKNPFDENAGGHHQEHKRKRQGGCKGKGMKHVKKSN